MAIWRVPLVLTGLSGRNSLFRQRCCSRINGRVSTIYETDWRRCNAHLHTQPIYGSTIMWSPFPCISNVCGTCQFRMYGAQPKDKEDKYSRSDQDKQEAVVDTTDTEAFNKLSLFQKFKAMYRDYWYVLVPVHLSSSVVFLGVFYYASSSGFDIVALLEKLSVSESIISPIRDSSAGYIAVTYALYKIFTPVRYTVTLAGTTWAIKFLTARGLIKPRPMKEAKQNVQNIITAMKMPENERQKFLEEKGMPRIGKAVGQASAAVSTSTDKHQSKKQ